MGRGVALLALAAAAPFAIGPSADLLGDMVLATAYVVMALGLNIVVGYAGLLDLGYVAFYAVGSYAAVHLASAHRDLHLDLLLVLVAAAGLAAAAGAVIGVPTLRLRGDYIAIVTLAFGEIIGQVALNGGDLEVLGAPLTAGPSGIGPVDRIDLPGVAPFDALHLRPWYWFGLALVACAVLVSLRLRDSRLGRAWIALRDDEDAAAAAGVPLARTKLLAYGLGAAFGAVAGVFLASYVSVVNGDQFAFSFSIFVLAMVVIGGMGSVAGVVAGAIVLTAVNSVLLPDVLHVDRVASGIYGVLIVLAVVLRPQGLLPAGRLGRPAGGARSR